MKHILLATLLNSSLLIAHSIKVEVTHLLNSHGKISIGLFNKDNHTFSKISKAFKGVELDISSKKVLYTFKNIPTGTYAIATFHDENKNKKLDKNFMGIPSEGYGFSNNIRPTFRGANFKESKFDVKSNKNISIKMGY